VGLPILLAGVAFMVFVGPRLLRPREAADASDDVADTLVAGYDLGTSPHLLRIPSDSALAGRAIRDTRIDEVLDLSIVAVSHRGRRQHAPAADTVLWGGDELVVVGSLDRLHALRTWRELKADHGPAVEILGRKSLVLHPRSVREVHHLVATEPDVAPVPRFPVAFGHPSNPPRIIRRNPSVRPVRRY